MVTLKNNSNSFKTIILFKNISHLYDCFIIYITGPFNVTTDDVRATWNFIGHVVNDTLIVEHFRMFPSVKKITIYFENLFQGNKELSKY